MYMILTYRTTCLRIYITTTSSIIIFFSNMISTMGGEKNEDRYWTIMEEEEDEEDKFNIGTSSSNSLEGSTVSNGSSSSRSSDMADDATSSSSSSSSLRPTGSLYDLSELMAKLPIKRGLSKFYQGKSQSFTSLSRVTSIEDLPKKETHFRRKMKASKSYGNGFDSYKSHTLPKPTISKKSSRSTTSLSALSFPSRRGCFVSSCRPPMIPQQKNLDFRPV